MNSAVNGTNYSKYVPSEKDWDDFIRMYDGVHCDKMCTKGAPTMSTKKLFDNDAASDLFCQWCQKK